MMLSYLSSRTGAHSDVTGAKQAGSCSNTATTEATGVCTTLIQRGRLLLSSS